MSKAVNVPAGRLWRTLRITIQLLALFLFLAVIVGSPSYTSTPSLASLPLWLSPLAMLSSLIASRTFFIGSLFSVSVILLALFLGRAWCGWLCPLGTLLDIFSFRRWFKKKPHLPEWMRSLKYGVLFTLITLAILGDQSLIFLDPISLAYRLIFGAFLPALDRVFSAVETWLYQAPFLRDGVIALDDFLRPAILPAVPVFNRAALWFSAAFVVLILFNFFAERFWCRYLCPLGGMLGLLAKLGLIKRSVNDKCTSCNACVRVCPTAAIPAKKGYASDPSECTLCMDCLRSCPSQAIDFKPVFKPASHQDYDPNRRVVLASLGAGIALAALPKVIPAAQEHGTFLLRPPGAGEEHLLSACIRCGACMRVCPTGGLQPALSEVSLNGLLTPVLVPRIGYCDYACTACGQICPTHAIPLLELADKQQRRIGQAYIDENRCIPWADGIPCAVCEEMCPVTPKKAITLSTGGGGGGNGRGNDGTESSVPRPHVDRSKCIGCGVCEARCPVAGEAAIRVRLKPG